MFIYVNIHIFRPESGYSGEMVIYLLLRIENVIMLISFIYKPLF